MTPFTVAFFPEHVQVFNSDNLCFMQMQINVCIVRADHVGPGEAFQQGGG